MPETLTVYPIQAPVRDGPFDLIETILDGLAGAELRLQDGDVLAVSSKYAAIAAGRIYKLDDVKASPRARQLAERYNMSAAVAQLVLDEAEHVFGGIEQGFLLTARGGIISPNAGLDRSNIPSGRVVLLPEDPFKGAEAIFEALQQRLGRHIGVILTDSWLLPGRYGTSGIALGAAGFKPIKDERGKDDLFGNPMAVTQVGVADSLAACAQVVMGERDQARPFALLRGADIELTRDRYSAADMSIPWQQCIYVESLTLGLLPDGAAQRRSVEINGDLDG
ncbi:MAG: coenzyme F420-0:L-glutamate ligase [Chloroflexi bacterium]|nr:coenzyme F420-0:L-glutamate ligase [Chloroflexota bacterium]